MDLTFDNRIAEFRAETHFNLHLEGAGSVRISKRTSGGIGALLGTISGDVIDVDIPVMIPKDYIIVCAKEPTMAEVTFAGGGVEANLITFTVDGYDKTFTAEEGMNWMQFCASEYNTEGWECGYTSEWVLLYEEGSGWSLISYYLDDPSSDPIPLGENLIKANHQYTVFEDGGIGGGGGSWG